MARCSSDSCTSSVGNSSRFRRVLWIALAINGGMFVAEIAAGMIAGSAALQADALDFFADASNYAISLFVLGMSLRWRAGAAWIKGASMGVFGTGAGWPDFTVALLMAVMALQGAVTILRDAKREWRSTERSFAASMPN